MKYLALYIALALFVPSITLARPISFWPYEKLYKEADLVAIVELKSISETKQELSGHGPTDRFDGKSAELTTGIVLKGKPDIRSIHLKYFVYSKKVNIIVNGAHFIDFSDAKKYQYLVFLKKEDNGTFAPVTGHYDAALSVKKLEKDHFSPIKEKE